MRVEPAEEIQAAQVGILYEQAPSALIATIVNAGILTAVMWTEVSRPLLISWLLSISLLDLVRYRLHHGYRRSPPPISEAPRWRRRYIYGVAANGLLWGFAGFSFFVEHSYAHQIFLTFVLAGMVSGAVAALSSVRGAHLAFLAPALVPFAARLMLEHSELHLAMAAMLLLYVTMMSVISERLRATVAESLRLRFENLSLLRNLTQAKELQELANAELERRVRERTERLAESQEALRIADRRKDEFLAMLGHELRSPLAPIRNAAQITRTEVPDSTMHWARDVIDRQVDHLTRLVDDLLDASRIAQGKIVLQETVLDLAGVVDHVVEASRPMIEARQQALSVSVPDGALWVRGDRVRLSQVISNLLHNATKFTDQHGRIELRVVEASEGWLAVRVRDNGIGIPAEVLPSVFDLFTQADHSLARTQGGLGIGLTLVKRVVEMHGGRVEARSGGPGQGAEFIVRLPRSAAPAEPYERVAPCRAISASNMGRRVLVVDDNQDSAESLAVMLRLEGFSVAVAFDGMSALEEAAKFQPETVLLDIGMPGMDGYQVARELRSQEPTRSSVILALTGYGQPEDRARGKAAGFNDHLTKPVDPVLLIEMLKS